LIWLDLPDKLLEKHAAAQEPDGFIRAETARWGTLIKQLGLRAE